MMLLISWVDDFHVFMQAREFLSGLGHLNQTQIFAKIENVEVRNQSDFSEQLLHMKLH